MKDSTMTPDSLPSISALRAITKSLAMLDAILCPEWDSRYFSFNSAWAPNMEMASMRNGCGDDWFLLFDPAGAALKGFAHELASDEAFAESIRTHVPAAFSAFLDEPAFSMQQATFCYWRRANGHAWSKAQSALLEDGSTEMLTLLLTGPSGYKEWAEDYYEFEVALDAAAAVFEHTPLSETLIASLNPDADINLVSRDAAGIGYPCVRMK
jgi:hypothetical protein